VKELSKITMPVVFNEPLSFLQRMVEYMEYAELLNQASRCDDPLHRLEVNDVYTVSKKRHLFYFCDIFVKFHPILLIFGRNMLQEI